MENKTQPANRCKRCHRGLKDRNARYGRRCAQILGLSPNESGHQPKPGIKSPFPENGLEELIYDAFKYDELQQKISELKQRNPNIETYIVDGELYWADPTTLQGIGFLPDGTLVHGNDTSAAHIELAHLVYMKGKNPKFINRDIDARIDGLARYVAKDTYDRSDERFIQKLKNATFYQIRTIDHELNQEILTQFKSNMLVPKFPASLGFAKFFYTVKNGAIVDLKNREPYKNYSTFIFNGEIISNDAPANILYGALGTYLGFPSEVLYFGAGAAQQLAGTSDPAWKETNYDDPRDQERITQGIHYFYEHPELWLPFWQDFQKSKKRRYQKI